MRFFRDLSISSVAAGFVAVLVGVAVRDEEQWEAAIVTFLVTASGVTLAGVGFAFWGLVAGGATMLIVYAGRKRKASEPVTPAE